MTETLQDTLKALMRSGTDSNPALSVLIGDYARYHVVLVAVGGLFLLVLVLLSFFFWRRFRRAPRTDTRQWTFEKTTYFYFGVVSVLVGLFLALIVAANVSNVISPRQGFSGSISMLGTPKAGTQTSDLYQSFDIWLQSGSSDMPSLVQARIDDRLSWQRPKAIICSILLLVFAVISALVWRTLIRKSRVREARWKLTDRALMLLGVVTAATCLLLMLMVLGNTQGSFAPISLTLFFG